MNRLSKCYSSTLHKPASNIQEKSIKIYNTDCDIKQLSEQITNLFVAAL